MPDEIEVKVSMHTGEYYFVVGITKFKGRKPYLGGYRNTMNGLSYHHGSSQTPTENKFTVKDTSDLRSRETQTYEFKTLSVQPVRECGTQMTRQDLLVDVKRDVCLKPRPYFTAEQLNELKKDKCIILQRTWRGHMARCQAAIQRKRNIEHQVQMESTLRATVATDKEQRAHDMLRRLHPVSNQDFEKLYNELDVWRKAEAAKIKATTTPGPERKKLMTALLANETKSLQSIQKLKVAARKSDHEAQTEKLLELMSKPYRWQLSNGETTFVQTPSTAKAAELYDLYQALRNTACISVDERLNVLFRLKQVVTTAANDYYMATQTMVNAAKASTPGSATATAPQGPTVVTMATISKHKNNANIALLRDISDLIDREADMLNRGRPADKLENMRLRLSNLLLQYIENPVYNPRAIEFVNLPKVTNANAATSTSMNATGTGGPESTKEQEQLWSKGGTGPLPVPPSVETHH